MSEGVQSVRVCEVLVLHQMHINDVEIFIERPKGGPKETKETCICKQQH